MSTSSQRVIAKVGGSLFDMPDLKIKLQSFLKEFANTPLRLLTGLGSLTNSLKELQSIHHLSDTQAHFLALASMSVGIQLLHQLLPELTILNSSPSSPDLRDRPATPALLDANIWTGLASDQLPRDWTVSSDSLALWAAQYWHADHLILLKSVGPPDSLADAQSAGWVDHHFSNLLNQQTDPLQFTWINLRTNTQRTWTLPLPHRLSPA